MIKFLYFLIIAILLSMPAEARRNKQILHNNKAYVFYLKKCPICQNALKDIDKKYLSRPDIIRVDLETKEGKELLKLCTEKFKIRSVVVPLFCMGDNHFMGWSSKASHNFDRYLLDLYPQ